MNFKKGALRLLTVLTVLVLFLTVLVIKSGIDSDSYMRTKEPNIYFVTYSSDPPAEKVREILEIEQQAIAECDAQEAERNMTLSELFNKKKEDKSDSCKALAEFYRDQALMEHRIKHINYLAIAYKLVLLPGLFWTFGFIIIVVLNWIKRGYDSAE